MAACIPDGEGLVIEIGAGTGAVTRAILARGVAPSRLLVLERSPEFCRILRGKFPELNVVQGDAALLSSYVSETDAVLAVVSSLPLMNFPSALRGAILEQIQKVIGGRGCVIQFTYALLGESPYARNGFRRDILRFIPRNLPPARVERFWLPSACPALRSVKCSGAPAVRRQARRGGTAAPCPLAPQVNCGCSGVAAQSRPARLRGACSGRKCSG